MTDKMEIIVTENENKVELVLPGNPIVERDGELVCGLSMTPDAARELAIVLIEYALIAEKDEDEDEGTEEEGSV